MLLLLSWIGLVHASNIVINEVMVGPDEADSSLEWVEIYNAGDAPVDLDGWSLQWGTSAGLYDGLHTFEAYVLEPGAFLVVGDESLASVTIAAEFSFGSGSVDSDSIRLMNTVTEYTDTLVYGTPNTDGWLDDSGEIAVSMAPAPDEGFSVGRIIDGVDTHDCGADFGVFAAPTPGESNVIVPEETGCAGSESLKINEVLYDPSGGDSGHEWLEIFNAGTDEVVLAGWQLEVGKSSLRVAITFDESHTLMAGDFLLLGESEVDTADVVVSLDMGNAGSNADIVRLRDCEGEVADTLVYGSPNVGADEWLDDAGVVAISTAMDASSGESLARIADGLDTDASGEDFEIVVLPTPGASNAPEVVIDTGVTADTGSSSDTGTGSDTGMGSDTGASPTVCELSLDIKINETQVIPESTPLDAGHEWVELYNAGTETVSLGGWRLQGGTSSVASFIEFDGDVVIGAGGFLLVGDAEVADRDVLAALSLGNAESDADIIQLVDCSGEVADTLIYGTPNSDEWLDDLGEIAVSMAPVPAAGESIARSSDGEDSDDAGLDFVVVTSPTPGGPFLIPDEVCESSGDIKINEVLANPEGVDAAKEWVELYNAGVDSVSLAGWQLEGGTSSLSVDVTFEEGLVLAPEAFLLVGEMDVEGADVRTDELSLGNAGSSSDIMRLLGCDGTVADTLVYGAPNDDEWVDDSGAVASSLAPVAPEGQTIARELDGVDTDASGVDFVSSPSPTPGEANEFTGSGDDADGGSDGTPIEESDCPGALSIKLNEVLVDPEGGDSGYEWIELFNAGSESVTLDDWSIEGGSSSASNYITFEGGVTLAPGEHLLVGDTEVVGADVVASITMGNASNSDMVRLVDCSDVVVDTLIYGTPNDDEWVDDSGSVATSLAPKAASGMTLARRSDGYDTDACGDDWMVASEATPGSENPATDPIVCVEGAKQIKINEFMVDPDSSLFGEEVTDSDLEWVELYNGSGDAASLAGWQLQWGKSGTYSGTFVFEAGASIAPGEWLLVGGSLVSGADVTTSFDMGNASSNSDAVRLVDCVSAVQDTVVYGPNNDDGWLDDEDEMASSFAEAPGKEKSAARRSDGVDTEQSGSDFVVSDSPTPGASNAGASVTGCVPGEMDIKINEILPDPEGTDVGFEFIELFNTSPDDLSIEGWALATGTSSWPSDAGYHFPAGASIPAGGFVVVAGLEVEGADFYTDEEEKFSLGNGSSAPDGVRLEDCTGEVQDTLLYGDPADPIEDLELEDDQGLSSMATMPESNMSVGRTDDGVDTDDNAEDFTTNMPPTPGESNAVRDLASGSGKGCGCGGKSEGPEGTEGPMEAGALAGLMVSVAMFVAMRRRED